MKSRKIPMRRCIGCMESKEKNTLIRIACHDGKISVDPTGKAAGRGVYLCRKSACMEQARKKRAIQRSLGLEFSEEELNRVFEELAEYEQ